MKRCLSVLVALCLQTLIHAQSPWQQQVNYTIDVSLNDKNHTLDGFEKIEYINNSPDTLRFIWFHIWPNAYKNDKTAFTDQDLENGDTRFYFADNDQRGYINRLDFRVNDQVAEMEDHPQHIDIIKVLLPSPLAPGQTITLTTPFHVKLPFNFSRGGHDGESYQVTQWYPKPAVYDKNGWHPMPYLSQGEFYSEFGNFDVSITVPDNYVVAATGDLQNESEKQWLLTRASFDWKSTKQKVKQKGGSYKTIEQKYPASSANTKTVRFTQDRVHDFAWFADKRFIVKQDTCRLASGRAVRVMSYYTPEFSKEWSNSLQFAKDAVRMRSIWIGEYPFNTVSVVQGPESFGGGMEYPTITVISPQENEQLLDFTISHEIGHNWFYGILGTDERRYPWLDEGLNTYFDNKYSRWKYPSGEIKIGNARARISDLERVVFETQAATRRDQPINSRSADFSVANYNLVAYYKAGAWLEYAGSVLGEGVVDSALRLYYRQWQFKHPGPDQLKQAMETVSGRNVDSLFGMLNKKGALPGMQYSGTRAIFLFDIKAYAKYLDKPVRNLFIFGPSVGYNYYDRFMIGGLFTNIKMPPSRFQYFLAPMYATGTGAFKGLGFANYNFFTDGTFRKITVGLAASTFTMDQFTDENDKDTYLSFYKVVPSLRLTLNQQSPRSNLHRYIQFKSFFIGEDALRFSRDTVVNGPGDTSILNVYRTGREQRTLNQLKLVVENNRALYPYSGELKIEQGTHFVRAGFTGNYFFNYARGGGLKARLFAGKFFYTGTKTIRKRFETDRYHLNMTGPNGQEDYTYSDYFVGRNEFEGTASQQIMERDGAFKVRSDLLADKVGKTDDWLMALNFSSSIPDKINPLSLLPIRIPLKIFADVGTQAGAWEKNSTEDRFLFDIGLQIPLLKETVNIYIPLFYSNVYKDYIQSTIPEKKFWKTISFSIDISNFSFRKLNRNLAD